MSQVIFYNGQVLPAGTPVAGSASRGLRYGEGVFETMRVVNGEIMLETYHFERLFHSLSLLKFHVAEQLTPEYLSNQILDVCERNNVVGSARVRLNAFRKDGSIYDDIDLNPNLLIEAWSIQQLPAQLGHGLVIDVFNDARKTCDRFSNLKSNSYMQYTMAAMYAKEMGLDDCLLLNTYGRICDSTISNIFWIEKEVVYTPPLSEGCVHGVMRQHLLKILPERGYRVQERMLDINTLQEADEAFLTNAISGVRWVELFRNKKFSNDVGGDIYSLLI